MAGNTKRWIDRDSVPRLVIAWRCSDHSCRISSPSPASAISGGIAEFGLIVLGLSIVSGGIDLSVSSIFTLAVLVS